MLQISRHRLDLVGEFDFCNAASVRDALGTAETPIKIDLSRVTFIDASTLSEFARLALRISPHKATLIAVPPHVRRILDIVHFHNILDY
jgi:anti-anti-sigma regulatory factor